MTPDELLTHVHAAADRSRLTVRAVAPLEIYLRAPEIAHGHVCVSTTSRSTETAAGLLRPLRVALFVDVMTTPADLEAVAAEGYRLQDACIELSYLLEGEDVVEPWSSVPLTSGEILTIRAILDTCEGKPSILTMPTPSTTRLIHRGLVELRGERDGLVRLRPLAGAAKAAATVLHSGPGAYYDSRLRAGD